MGPIFFLCTTKSPLMQNWIFRLKTYVIINVFGWSFAMFQNVVVVSVIDHKNSPGFEQTVKVGNSSSLILLISTKVGQVSEGIPHAYKSVETFASAVFLHAFMQSQPISFLDNPIVKGSFSSSVPSEFVGSFEHFVRGI